MLKRLYFILLLLLAAQSVAEEPLVILDQSSWSKRVEATLQAHLSELSTNKKKVARIYIYQNANQIPQNDDCLAISAVGESKCKYSFKTRPDTNFMGQLYKTHLPGKRIGIIHNTDNRTLVKNEVPLPLNEHSNLVREAAYRARKDFDVLMIDHYIFNYNATDITLLLEMSYRKSVPLIAFLPIESKGALFSIDTEKFLKEEFEAYVLQSKNHYVIKKVYINVNNKLNVLYGTGLPDHRVFEVVE
jgi:hypothetical protein